MLRPRAGARTRNAFGRFVCVLGLWAGGSCAVPESAGREGPQPRELEHPVLEVAPLAPSRQAEAAGLVARAEAALAGGGAVEALRLARRVVEEFPASSSSGKALLLVAQAGVTVGDGTTAEEAALRYLALVPSTHPRVPELRVLHAEAAADSPDRALTRLAELPPMADRELRDRVVGLARAVVLDAPDGALESFLAEAAADADARPVVEVRAAALALFRDNVVVADSLAREALAHGAAGTDAALAEAVLSGELPQDYLPTREVTLGAVLPLQGAPALASFSELVLEGIEVAAVTATGRALDVRVAARDDGGDVGRTAAVVRELEAAGVAGIVGFLEEVSLEVAAGARVDGVPLVSPTARAPGIAAEGVYSLEGVDSVGIHALARLAASRGYQRVAFIESTSPLSAEEADLFERELLRFGIPNVGRFAYEEGATFFEPQIQSARDALREDEIAALGLTEDDTLHVEILDPVGVFVPVPAEDVELLAPQITHFGPDTLGIEVMGTRGWTDAETLRLVDSRHTDRVMATAAMGSGADAPGFLLFREAYEAYFQRTLVSAVPALGYDAALLILEALRRGARTPSGIVETLGGLEDVEGATGLFGLVDGRVVRRTQVVRVEERTLTPIPTG